MRFVHILCFLCLLLSVWVLPRATAVNDVQDVTLQGHVLDVYGNGINHACVSALDYLTGMEYETTTDLNGFFEFQYIETGKLYFICISANGYYHYSKHDCRAGTAYVFTLNKSASIIGTISDADGNPINNARIFLANEKCGVELSANSDATGSFRFTSSAFNQQLYPDSGYEVSASAVGFIKKRVEEDIAIAYGEEKQIRIVLNRSSVVSGTVRDNAGTPVSNATVLLTDAGGFTVCAATTGIDGKYTLNTDISAGNYTVQVFPEANQNGSYLNSEPVRVSVSYAGEHVENIDFTLMTSAILCGNVTDENGALPNALVTVSSETGFAYGYSDAQGRFVLTSPTLRTGSYRVHALCAHHLSTEKWVNLVEGTETCVDFNLPASRSVSGYIKNASNDPIQGCVEIFDESSNASVDKTYTSVDGFFILDTNLFPAKYIVRVSAPGYITTSKYADLTTTSMIENFNFTLSESGKAIVNITDETNAKLENALGYLFKKNTGVYVLCESTSSGTDGMFVFGQSWEPLAPGTYSLLVKNAPGCENRFFEDAITIENGKTNYYTFTLKKSAEIYGYVYYRKNTELIADVHLEFFCPDANTPFGYISAVTCLSDAEGYFHVLTGVSEGTYTITATSYKYGIKTVNVSVLSGEVHEVNIYFAEPTGKGTITGTIKEKNGDALSNVKVSVYNGTKFLKSAYTNDTGRFTLTDIPEGKYRLNITRDGYVSIDVQNVSVLSDEITDTGIIELEKYIPLGSIKGYVVDEHGNPLPGASITIEGTDISVVSDTLGEFRITGLKEGVYFLHVSCAGYKDAQQPVSVIPENETEVWVQMVKESPPQTTPGFVFMEMLAVLSSVFIIRVIACRRKK